MDFLPPLSDILETLHTVRLPMNVTFRGIRFREVALWEGPAGWTEFSPFIEYDASESSSWLSAAIEYGWADASPIHRNRVDINATLPAVEASAVVNTLSRFSNFSTVKVKVAEMGQTLSDDIARIRAVSEHYPEAKIRIDANGGWSVDEATEALESLAFAGLEYVEQPCRSVPELAELKKRQLGVPIAADESIRKAEDPYLVAESDAADIIVIKAQPLGGVVKSLKLVEDIKLTAVVSSALETSIGLQMGIDLAGALPNLDYANGLGTARFFVEDVVPDSATLNPVNGFLETGQARLSPDPTLLRRFALPENRHQWWRQRITDCYRLLDS